MKCVVQRVVSASVWVDGTLIAEIGQGLLVLGAVAKQDTEPDLQWMADKLAGFRVFPQGDKHFELDVRAAGGSILLVSNFTVCAQTRKGRRPSLDEAAPPEVARGLFERFVELVRATGIPTFTGQFAGDMRVELVNDGPATFVLDNRPTGA